MFGRPFTLIAFIFDILFIIGRTILPLQYARYYIFLISDFFTFSLPIANIDTRFS